jgi:hypothetical protein
MNVAHAAAAPLNEVDCPGQSWQQKREESAMKNHVHRVLTLAVIAIALTGLCVAQQFAYRVAADVPYDFYVGDQQLPAGSYIFAVNYSDHAVTIQNQATGKSSVVMALPVVYASPGYDRRNDGPVVELSSVGGKYMLADLQTRTSGVTFPGVPSNRLSAKNEGTVTIVAALR